jgi:hypothetical protein
MATYDGQLFALEFPDGLTAGEFAAALHRHLAGGSSATPGSDERPVVWILEPFVHRTAGEVCCVYLNTPALEVAKRAGLDVSQAEAIAHDDLPERRLQILG